ncbi:murein hydrolase activator EnvC family protein [Alicyclobacillus dauci]|uniref:Peptidoglycan hydrolase PcsB coiled-coil domain-containing protein n=1 Tax=Alicyclobacillus dauci TaxID=1475485 RepID=A0ABY6Z213_9BACL|nr:hypothetical protein [Alicyclobacillus dauci]WAH36774.1 hypothetical protein NZD86_21795 [Alicyclobacillus dauci]
MRYVTQAVLSVGTLCASLGLLAPTVQADNLSNAKDRMQQLNAASAENAQSLTQEKQAAQNLQDSIQSYQKLIDSLSQSMAQTRQELDTTQAKLDDIQSTLNRLKKQLNITNNDFQALTVALYEQGNVPYLEVLFKATSFSDLLSRFQDIVFLTKAEQGLAKKILALHNKVSAEEKQQAANLQSLNKKKAKLAALQRIDASLKQQKQVALARTKQQIQSDVNKQQRLRSQKQWTQAQINQMEAQIQNAGNVLSTTVGLVVEQDLRYRSISPMSLYNYVQAHDSTFSLGDIETICNAARSYDVNPALLIAITGQEQAFVPPSADAGEIRNNPFNVFYSWQVYNTNLADAANIAANTLRHKLSVSPPSGEDPIHWINDPANPWGIYATDPNWANGVETYFNSIMQQCG